MIADALQTIINRRLTTVREIEEVTGRASSTVYRWLSRESEPGWSDVRSLLTGLHHPQARQSLLDDMVSELPVSVTWFDAQPDGEHPTPTPVEAQDEAVQAMIACVREVGAALQEVHKVARSAGNGSATHAVSQLDTALRRMLAVRQFLAQNRSPSYPDASPSRPAPATNMAHARPER